jgi:hypothetical protein
LISTLHSQIHSRKLNFHHDFNQHSTTSSAPKLLKHIKTFILFRLPLTKLKTFAIFFILSATSIRKYAPNLVVYVKRFFMAQNFSLSPLTAVTMEMPHLISAAYELFSPFHIFDFPAKQAFTPKTLFHLPY